MPREQPPGPRVKLSVEPFKLTTEPDGKTKIEFPELTIIIRDAPFKAIIGPETTFNPNVQPGKLPFEDSSIQLRLEFPGPLDWLVKPKR